MCLQFIKLFIIVYDAKNIKYLNEIATTYCSTSRQMVLDIFSPPGAKKIQSGKRTTFRYPLPPSSFHKRVEDMLKWTSYSCSAYNYNPLEAFKSLIQHKN